MKKWNWNSYIAGMLTVALLAGVGGVAGAASTTNRVSFNTVNIGTSTSTIAGKGNGYRLSNGSLVPYSITYTDDTGGGTVYVPLSKFSEYTGTEVSWDGANNKVILDVDASIPYNSYTGTNSGNYKQGYDDGYKAGSNGSSGNYSAGYNDGYDDGYDDGRDSGYYSYNDGYDDGYLAGLSASTNNGSSTSGSYSDGYNAGFAAGEKSGYDKGYAAGLEAAQEEDPDDDVTVPDRYQEGYNAGFADGKEEGIEEGKESGYQEGYNDGYQDGLDDAEDETDEPGQGTYDFYDEFPTVPDFGDVTGAKPCYPSKNNIYNGVGYDYSLVDYSFLRDQYIKVLMECGFHQTNEYEGNYGTIYIFNKGDIYVKLGVKASLTTDGIGIPSYPDEKFTELASEVEKAKREVVEANTNRPIYDVGSGQWIPDQAAIARAEERLRKANAEYDSYLTELKNTYSVVVTT